MNRLNIDDNFFAWSHLPTEKTDLQEWRAHRTGDDGPNDEEDEEDKDFENLNEEKESE